MGVQRVLAIIGTKITEYVGLQSSAGTGSAGQLIALNALGSVDATMIPQLDLGADNNTPTNGVFGLGVGVVAATDFGLVTDVRAAVSDWGLVTDAITTTIDLGIIGS